MSREDRKILDLFAARVRASQPDARIWAFGSRARGDAAPDSDLDICVVVPALTPAVGRRVRTIAWELGFEHERVIATVVVPVQAFEHGPLSASTLVKSIRDEGIAA